MSSLSRRNFLSALAASGVAANATSQSSRTTRIDRRALITRHNPVLHQPDPLSPLSVGNGEFAFTADVTGLQTFPLFYERQMPLCTMSQWGWHTTPSSFNRQALRLTPFDTFGRSVGYAINSDGQKDLYNWLRENPHRLHLGQIGFRLTKQDGTEARLSDLTDIEQTLDLWSGLLHSRFRFDGSAVVVRTAVPPQLDTVAVEVESPLIAQGRLQIRVAFPYGSSSMQAADWQQPNKHQSKILAQPKQQVLIGRTLDNDQYFVGLSWRRHARLEQKASHEFWLTGQGDGLAFTAQFAPRRNAIVASTSQATLTASETHWRQFWTNGAAIELAASRDPRAKEIERRVVLSQYLTAIQCAGSLPPQETGLTVNSWYGKFHLEMHWWHSAHFALWGRLPLLEKNLGYYDAILPQAQALAGGQGYTGARWPKMTSRDGFDSPSQIGPLLIWQQPHPIFYAELCYLNRPTRKTLERYRNVVFESAEFMASFAHFDERSQRFVLGPPVIPAQENHPPRETWNPTFELNYWRFGLQTAQRWRERLGLAREEQWDRVLAQLAPLPVRDGVYLAHENCPQTFTERNRDHPSMLGALGMLPGDGVDHATMRRTLDRCLKDWRWDDTWGWDYPLTAMTAARLLAPELAVDALLMPTPKNRYLPNGHNYQRENLPCYLPGNGGLLYAVALMAIGWKGAPKAVAPGFPANGLWTVHAEGFNATVLRQL